ncbi:hypothetical protein B0H19DRAFT_1077068 [Mycena capillaripes]|nr:hypothetical protein B0H19DRAFT_1077068 [Mycena capillaripes]
MCLACLASDTPYRQNFVWQHIRDFAVATGSHPVAPEACGAGGTSNDVYHTQDEPLGQPPDDVVDVEPLATACPGSHRVATGGYRKVRYYVTMGRKRHRYHWKCKYWNVRGAVDATGSGSLQAKQESYTLLLNLVKSQVDPSGTRKSR